MQRRNFGSTDFSSLMMPFSRRGWYRRQKGLAEEGKVDGYGLEQVEFIACET